MLYAALEDELRKTQAQLNAEISGLTSTVAERVASATPGAVARPDALANAAALMSPLHPVNGVPIDVTTGATMSTREWAVDHIVSRSEIARDPRFARLSPLQQLDLLLGIPENYLPMTGVANSSKGGLSVPIWITARADAGRPIPPEVAVALLAADKRARDAIEAKFREFATTQ
jgi:hypothetical protein